MSLNTHFSRFERRPSKRRCTRTTQIRVASTNSFTSNTDDRRRAVAWNFSSRECVIFLNTIPQNFYFSSKSAKTEPLEVGKERKSAITFEMVQHTVWRLLFRLRTLKTIWWIQMGPAETDTCMHTKRSLALSKCYSRNVGLMPTSRNIHSKASKEYSRL